MDTFKKMDRATLINLRQNVQAELTKLSTVKLEDDQIVKDAHAARVAQLQGESDAIDQALVEKGNEGTELNHTVGGDSHGYELNRLVSSIRCAMDRIGNFKQGGLIN